LGLDEGFIQADRVLVSSLANGDAGAAAELLDDAFTLVNINGRVFTKLQLALDLPVPALGDEAGITPALRHYGEVAVVTAERGKVFVLRIWVKRAGAWRALAVHEVSQNLPPAPRGPGRKDWDNPCRTVPYAPRNADERDCLASWQQLETAVMAGDAELWACHIADEFMVYGPTRRHSKADRKKVLEEQKRSGTHSAPAPLVSAQMFGFAGVMVMTCEHQPFHGNAAQVSRVFVKRDGQWLMAISFQTTRQGAAVKTI
jgi:hypothetical protein